MTRWMDYYQICPLGGPIAKSDQLYQISLTAACIPSVWAESMFDPIHCQRPHTSMSPKPNISLGLTWY